MRVVSLKKIKRNFYLSYHDFIDSKFDMITLTKDDPFERFLFPLLFYSCDSISDMCCNEFRDDDYELD